MTSKAELLQKVIGILEDSKNSPWITVLSTNVASVRSPTLEVCKTVSKQWNKKITMRTNYASVAVSKSSVTANRSARNMVISSLTGSVCTVAQQRSTTAPRAPTCSAKSVTTMPCLTPRTTYK